MSEGSSPLFILAGISIDASYWKEFYHKIDSLRIQIRQKFDADFGEFKGSELFEHQGAAYKLRLSLLETQYIYDNLIDLVFDAKVQRYIIVLPKSKFREKKPYIEEKALQKQCSEQIWQTMISQFENSIVKQSQEIDNVGNGLIYIDGQPDKQINRLVRQRARSFEPNNSYANIGLIENPIYVDSKSSTFIQLADILAHSVSRIHRKIDQSSININKQLISELKNICIYL